MTSLVLFEVSERVATVTLNRPERHNSLVPQLLVEMLVAFSQAGESEARAVVLQANGRSFSTGGDVRGLYDHRDNLENYAFEIVDLLNRVMLAMIAFPAPIVAAVHGIVTGGSLGLVLASDLVLVSPEASFTPYYTPVGFSPDGGWTVLLPWLIGIRRAEEVLLLNRTIEAEQAAEWGLANRVVPAECIREHAQATARMIAESKSGSIKRAKRLLLNSLPNFASRLEEERAAFVEQIVSKQASEGMEAFLGVGKI